MQHPFERVITQLRFPLMAGIVIIHCYLPIQAEADTVIPQPSAGIMYFMSQILARICVPLFFLISGYLFFYRKSPDGPSFYLGQWKKRCVSLLVPYILWNLFALLLLAVKTYGPLSAMFPRLAAQPLVWSDLLDAFWAFRPGEPSSIYEPSSAPVNVPMWFIRDLLVIMLFTPLIYRLVRPRAGFLLPLCLASLFVAGIWFGTNAGYSLSCVCFFTAGSWLAVHRIDPVEALASISGLRTAALVTTAAYLVSAIAELLTVGEPVNDRLHGLSIVLGTVWLIALAGWICASTRRSMPAFLTDSSFFVYGFHSSVTVVLRPLVYKALHPTGNAAWLTGYFATILTVTAISLAAYYLCRRYLPRLTSLLTGSR